MGSTDTKSDSQSWSERIIWRKNILSIDEESANEQRVKQIGKNLSTL